MTVGRADYLALGDWNATCDMCGKKFKASMLKRRWDGAMVCTEDWEPRQPQDFVRGVPDKMAPPWTRPMPAPAWAPDEAPGDPQYPTNPGGTVYP